jgi:hypothetical protein
MMKMPRRVRRRLLLPPGWVALGFLLLLGCQALQPWQRQLRQMSVLQLTMPKLKLTPADVENHGKEYQIIYKPLAELNKLRPWYDTEFTGKELPDFFSAAATESAIQKIIADTSHAGGVRIRFWPGATYANLVEVLDIMNRTNQKKYWMDIRNSPITLYAITDKPAHGKSPLILTCGFTCGMRYINAALPIKEVSFQSRLTKFWKELSVLVHQPWQAVTLWLAILSGLSLWRLLHPKMSRRNFYDSQPIATAHCLPCHPPYAAPFSTCRKRKKTSC